MTDELVHTEQCLVAQAKYGALLHMFIGKYPGYCRECGGAGCIEHSFDPSPAGVSLSPGVMTDDDPCPECEGAEHPICGLCRTPLFFDPAHGELRRDCGCPQDLVEPYQPECFCWEAMVDEGWAKFLGKGGE